MKLIRLDASNFGSYASLGFNFYDNGLALIHGPTGCGKSTLMDAACWTLYGLGSKSIGADEVRSWGASEATEAALHVDTPTGLIVVTRKRGKQNENDLYWTEAEQDQKHRGKDITETQKLLNQRLGCGPELYLAGAYSHEFSATGAFFTAKAKDRRELFELLADLSLPKELLRVSSGERSTARKCLDTTSASIQSTDGRVGQIVASIKDSEKRSNAWETERDSNIRQLIDKERSFEETNQKEIDKYTAKRSELLLQVKDEAPMRCRLDHIAASIKELPPGKCKECGAPKQADRLIQLQKDKAAVVAEISSNDSVLGSLERIDQTLEELTGRKVNVFVDELEKEKVKVNPFSSQLNNLKLALEVAEADKRYYENEAAELSSKITCLSQLYDISSILRAQLLQIAISNVEHQTNYYLTRFFDGEFRVGFTMTDSDDLDITIDKNGQECSYRQLSKGQRRLLTLCFTVSVMKAASERSGIDFNCVFMDEGLDGLDSSLKVKAFGLLEELASQHESVFIIEHSEEIKQLFSRSYQVELVGDHSEIKEYA